VSYDNHLVLVRPGETVRDAARREQALTMFSPQEMKTRNDRIVAAMNTRYPEFEKFESDHHIELNDVKGGTGIQVGLYADSGSISVPYWHNENAASVLQKVGDVLSTVLDNSEFRAFDPQTEQELNAGSFLSQPAPAVYAFGAAALQRVAKKPWWRFWQ
jgi:hypothetical protein